MTDSKDPQTDIQEQDAALTTAGEVSAAAIDDDGAAPLPAVTEEPEAAAEAADGEAETGQEPDAGGAGQTLHQLTGKVEALEREMEKERNRARLLPRIEDLLQAVATAEAPPEEQEGLEALKARLESLESTSRQRLAENLQRKEELCARAEALADSTDWKATTDAMKGLQSEWKAVGPAPPDRADEVWTRFRGAMDRFFDRRKEYLENHDQSLRENLERKEALCVRAEELAGSTEWKATAEAMKGLQDEWRAVGPVPPNRSSELWNRFRAAMDQFFLRRKEHYDRQEKEQKENFRRKEALCVRAEELADSTDWKETAEALKTLQAEWKSIGPVPRKKADALWGRFHGACDRFFTRRNELTRGERGRGGDWRDRLLDTLERKRDQANRLRDSLDRDEENLERWRSNLSRLRSGPGVTESRAELEGKIADVESRAQSKRTRLDELEASIQEISAKL